MLEKQPELQPFPVLQPRNQALCKSRSVWVAGNATLYKRLNGRMERVQATITAGDLGKGTATNLSSRLEAQRMANCKKVQARHFLAKNLEGSGGARHVFSQMPGINMGRYRAFEMHIANKIRDHGSGKVDILFKYQNENSRISNAIWHNYEVDGEKHTQPFKNPNPYTNKGNLQYKNRA